MPGNPVAILWKQCPMFYCTDRQDRVPRANTYYILRDRNNEIIEASIGADEKTRQTLEKDGPCRKSNCFIWESNRINLYIKSLEILNFGSITLCSRNRFIVHKLYLLFRIIFFSTQEKDWEFLQFRILIL